MSSTNRFVDRTDAGEKLGEVLIERGVTADLVLAIPRGGLPLGRAVADALECPLDVVVATKIGAPGNPEYAIGAVASDGSVWRNEEAFAAGMTDDSYFEQEKTRQAERARNKAEQYREGRSPPSVEGKTVVVVDDGVATGSTTKACVRTLDNRGTDRIIVAVPVGPPDTITELEQLADEVVCLHTPTYFRAVGQFYNRFDQVPDEEAMTYL